MQDVLQHGNSSFKQINCDARLVSAYEKAVLPSRVLRNLTFDWRTSVFSIHPLEISETIQCRPIFGAQGWSTQLQNQFLSMANKYVHQASKSPISGVPDLVDAPYGWAMTADQNNMPPPLSTHILKAMMKDLTGYEIHVSWQDRNGNALDVGPFYLDCSEKMNLHCFWDSITQTALKRAHEMRDSSY